MPDDASSEDRQRYLANFEQALYESTDVEGLSPIDALVRREVSIYLSAYYDPRPLDQIIRNVRAVLMGQMGRA